ncbi:hypothetical protein CY35_04G037900 [Sphagnum magellanicum]|nr:hypothetical protein CY35_04G037900 [Sphagnum magellanicum]
MIHVSGSFAVGIHFVSIGEGVVVEGVPSGLSRDVQNRCVGMVSEQFCMEPGVQMGSFCISKQDLYIQQLSRDVGRNGYSCFAYGRVLCAFS